MLTNRLADAFSGMKGAPSQVGDPQAIFQEGARSQIPPDILNKVIDAMSQKYYVRILLALFPIALAAITVVFMGNARVRTSNEMKENE